MIILQKILVTTDLSDHSLAAMEYASTLSLFYGARLYLLHVEDITPPAMYSINVAYVDGKKFQDQAVGEGRKRLEEFTKAKVIPMMGQVNVKVEPVLRFGKPVEEIQRFVEEEGVDLIVMATHGRTGLKHVLLGSIAEKLVRISSVPVLTVKPMPMRDMGLAHTDIENELHLR